MEHTSSTIYESDTGELSMRTKITKTEVQRRETSDTQKIQGSAGKEVASHKTVSTNGKFTSSGKGGKF